MTLKKDGAGSDIRNKGAVIERNRKGNVPPSIGCIGACAKNEHAGSSKETISH